MVKKIVRLFLILWVLGVGQFMYYYGNLPILTGGNSITATQSEAVEIKGTTKYITPHEKFLFDLSRDLFFGTLALGVLVAGIRVYGPAPWKEKLKSLGT